MAEVNKLKEVKVPLDREHFSMDDLNRMYEEAMNPTGIIEPQDPMSQLLLEARAQREGQQPPAIPGKNGGGNVSNMG